MSYLYALYSTLSNALTFSEYHVRATILQNDEAKVDALYQRIMEKGDLKLFEFALECNMEVRPKGFPKTIGNQSHGWKWINSPHVTPEHFKIFQKVFPTNRSIDHRFLGYESVELNKAYIDSFIFGFSGFRLPHGLEESKAKAFISAVPIEERAKCIETMLNYSIDAEFKKLDLFLSFYPKEMKVLLKEMGVLWFEHMIRYLAKSNEENKVERLERFFSTLDKYEIGDDFLRLQWRFWNCSVAEFFNFLPYTLPLAHKIADRFFLNHLSYLSKVESTNIEYFRQRMKEDLPPLFPYIRSELPQLANFLKENPSYYASLPTFKLEEMAKVVPNFAEHYFDLFLKNRFDDPSLAQQREFFLICSQKESQTIFKRLLDSPEVRVSLFPDQKGGIPFLFARLDYFNKDALNLFALFLSQGESWDPSLIPEKHHSLIDRLKDVEKLVHLIKDSQDRVTLLKALFAHMTYQGEESFVEIDIDQVLPILHHLNIRFSEKELELAKVESAYLKHAIVREFGQALEVLILDPETSS